MSMERWRNSDRYFLFEIVLYIFREAVVTDLRVSDQIMAQCPAGEEDDVMLASLFYFRKVGKEAEHPDGSPFDLQRFAGSVKAHLCHFLVGVCLFAAYVVGDICVEHVLHDKVREIRAVNDIGLDLAVALKKLHLALVYIGLKDLADIVEVPCGTVNDPVHGLLFQLLLDQILCVQHRDHFRARLIAGNNGNIIEFFHACALSFLVQIQIALLIDIVGGEPCGGSGQAHCRDDDFRSVTETFQGRGVCGVDGNEGVFALQPLDFSFFQVSGCDFVIFFAECS